MRLAIGLACLSLYVFWLALMTGVLPGSRASRSDSHRTLAEAIAVRCERAARDGDDEALCQTARTALKDDAELLTAEIRRANGSTIVLVGPDRGQAKSGTFDEDRVSVPIRIGETIWGSVDLRFGQHQKRGLWQLAHSPEIRFVTFFSVLSFCFQLLYLWSLLEHVAVEPATAAKD